MSKWKDKDVTIIQIVIDPNNSRFPLYGLGDDGLTYYWAKSRGAWVKNWNWEEDDND